MHNLVHHPRCIRMFGPPLARSTMRFDSKHSYFKRVHNQNHNHIHLLSSLSNRHQELQLYHLLTDNYFIDYDFGSEHNVNTQIKDYVSCTLATNNLQFFNFVSFITRASGFFPYFNLTAKTFRISSQICY